MIFEKALNELNKQLTKIEEEWKRRFPEGTIVSFKRGNMTDYDEAKVLNARFYHIYPELRVQNLRTGKYRDISYDDLSPSCRTDGDNEEVT